MSACRWNGATNPRTIVGRHGEDCAGDACPGCQPCTEPHCRVCSHTHADGTCAECMAATRADLHEIARMVGSLPEEVEHRGINGEAMVLLGPTADPEARQHVEGAYLSGRLPEGWIEANHGKGCPLLWNEACAGCGGDERHPNIVLLSWQMVWRDALEHDEAGDSELSTAVTYLDMQMTYMGGYEHAPFEDFAKDLRRCVAHLEAVLHDGEQVERSNVQCIEKFCSAPLERVYATTEDHDGWRCSSDHCRAMYDHARYARALHQHLASEGAEKWVRISDAMAVLSRPEMTLRTWVSNGDVESHRDDNGAVKVWWPDVRRKDIEASRRIRKARPCA